VSRTQRLSFFAVAAVVAVVAVVVILVAGGGSDDNGGSSNAASTGKVPVLTQGKVTKLDYTEGDQVKFQVRLDHADEIHVHGYNIEKEAEADKPVTFSFKATINGIFEIELHHSDAQIGQLTVQPK
jgi:hypothetical protein